MGLYASLLDTQTVQRIEAAWQRGILEWLLRPVQVQIQKSVNQRKSRKPVIHCSRRLGKSYLLVKMALEFATKYPRWPVRYVAPSRVGLRQIIHPIFQDITKTCPPHLKPEWNTVDNQYQLPSGGLIHLSGVNNGHEDDPRGTASGLAIVDEAGFIDHLEYVVQSVLMPQTINTGGFVILSSSSPKTPAHEFVGFIQEAAAAGDYSLYDIYAAGYPPEIVDEFMREAGGGESSTWKREYLCKLVVDESSAVVPEWDDRYIQDWPRNQFFPFYQTYEAMDVGGRDKTAVLFGYYDFLNTKCVIEDEFIVEGPRMTTKLIADEVKAREIERWKEKPVHLRVADNNNVILLNDLQAFHGLSFAPTSKDDLEAMVNQVRLFVKQGRVIVHPRCKELTGCLRYGIWNEKRTEFARSKAFGHFDALASLVYFIRNVDTVTNPIPANYGKTEFEYFIPPATAGTPDETAILKALLPGGRT